MVGGNKKSVSHPPVGACRLVTAPRSHWAGVRFARCAQLRGAAVAVPHPGVRTVRLRGRRSASAALARLCVDFPWSNPSVTPSDRKAFRKFSVGWTCVWKLSVATGETWGKCVQSRAESRFAFSPVA